jgi:hypothetical protein
MVQTEFWADGRQPASDPEECRGRASIAAAKQFSQDVRHGARCASPRQRQAVVSRVVREESHLSKNESVDNKHLKYWSFQFGSSRSSGRPSAAPNE